jgi:hypothetical protein
MSVAGIRQSIHSASLAWGIRMRIVDRILSVLLLLGAVGHTVGVLQYYRDQPDPLFWSLCVGFLIVLVAAINLLRTWRTRDRAIAWIAAGASAAYLATTLGFGRLIGDMADPRVIGFSLLSVGLFSFSVLDALKPVSRNSGASF